MAVEFNESLLMRVGLGALPEPDASHFLLAAREEFELRVGIILTTGLSDSHLEEFEAFVDQNLPLVSAWLERHCPNFASDPDFVELLQEVDSGLSDEGVVCEYASARWLALHIPNYRELVRMEFERFAAEIAAGSSELPHGMGISGEESAVPSGAARDT